MSLQKIIVDRKIKKIGHQLVILYSFRPPDVSEMRNLVAIFSFVNPLDFPHFLSEKENHYRMGGIKGN